MSGLRSGRTSAPPAPPISDLILFSRIESAASAADVSLVRADSPADLPLDLDLILVDWSAHQPDWTDALRARTASRVILFGQHTDLEAHADARAASLGPMWARSQLLTQMSDLLAGPHLTGLLYVSSTLTA